MKRFQLILGALLFLAAPAFGQRIAPPPPSPPSIAGPEFYHAADEVLAEMSHLLALPQEAPLKKSIRSRAEIRKYLLDQMKEDKEPAKRYADQKVLEALGLLPDGFDLDGFLVDLLTEEIAGLYDPKAGEFYIADWIPIEEQRMVMAHELTHALQDQHFHIDGWLKAARPNDDAELARDAVLEGSAVAAMIDYDLRETKRSVRDSADLTPIIQMAMGEADKSTELAKAPPFVKDSLLFPYQAGAAFTQRLLKAGTGWNDFQKVFTEPPVSTQQILHPELYLRKVTPRPVKLPDFSTLLPKDWKELDENVFGEFGLEEILKQFLGTDRANALSPSWAGDRYAIFESSATKRLLLVFRLRLASDEEAARFFGSYSEALELKHSDRKNLFRRPNFFQFDTDGGGVFLRCLGDNCLAMEGADRRAFDQITQALGWPAAPRPTRREPDKALIQTAAR